MKAKDRVEDLQPCGRQDRISCLGSLDPTSSQPRAKPILVLRPGPVSPSSSAVDCIAGPHKGLKLIFHLIRFDLSSRRRRTVVRPASSPFFCHHGVEVCVELSVLLPRLVCCQSGSMTNVSSSGKSRLLVQEQESRSMSFSCQFPLSLPLLHLKS